MTNEAERAKAPAGNPTEESEPEQGFLKELAQFFIIPALIVALVVAIFLMFGLLSHEDKGAAEFLQEIRTKRGNDRWVAAYNLTRALGDDPGSAGQSAGAGNAANAGLTREIIAALKEEGKDDPKVRKYLIIALERLGDPQAAPVIVESLKDPDPDVRLQSARALGVMAGTAGTGGIGGVAGAVGPLAELLADEDPAIRKVAVYALGQTRDPSAILALVPRLEDPIEDIRWNAAVALAVLGDASGREVIMQMLDREHLEKVEGITDLQKEDALINGVQAAYLLRDGSFAPRVRELSRSDPSLKVRDIAIKALEVLDHVTP